jgi:hypothetical protein
VKKLGMSGPDGLYVDLEVRVSQPATADYPQACKCNSGDAAFADWTVGRISRLLDGGLIEIGFVIRNGAATALRISGMLLQEPGRSILHF